MPPSFRPKRFPMPPEAYNLDVRLRHIEDWLGQQGGSGVSFNVQANSTLGNNAAAMAGQTGGGSGGGGGLPPNQFVAILPASTARNTILAGSGTVPISLSLLDTGGGADSPALRPSFLQVIHHTTAVTVPGVGARQDYVVADNGGTDVVVCSEVGEITAVAAGAVDGTIGWEVRHNGTLCETARIRASTGLAVTAATAFDGNIGGELWVRGNFFAGASGEGTAGIGVQAVAGTKLTIQATADSDKLLVLLPHSAGQNGNLLEAHNSLGASIVTIGNLGGVSIAPTSTSATPLSITAPASSTATLMEIAYTGVGNAFHVSSPGAAETNHFASLDDAGIAVRVTGHSATQSAVILQVESSAFDPYLTVAQGGLQSDRLKDATTNTVSDALLLDHQTTGTPAAGFGHSIHLTGQSSTTTGRDMARLDALWATATDASRKARLVLSVWDTAVREGLRVEASGSAPLIGFLGASAVARTSAYTVTNPVTNRSFDTTTVTTQQLAQVVGTILSDLQGFGLFG